MKKLLIVLVTIFLAGCATTGSQRQDRAISAGATWGTVGAITGALVGVAGQTHVGQAAAIGALALGVPAMAAEMLESAPPPAVAAPAPTPVPVHLPGLKEVYISGCQCGPEVRFVVIRELRALGYKVSEISSAPLYLRVEQKEIGDQKYVVIAYLVDRASGRILAQGRGEVRLAFITEGRRIEAKKQAAIAAIRSLQ